MTDIRLGATQMVQPDRDGATGGREPAGFASDNPWFPVG